VFVHHFLEECVRQGQGPKRKDTEKDRTAFKIKGKGLVGKNEISVKEKINSVFKEINAQVVVEKVGHEVFKICAEKESQAEVVFKFRTVVEEELGVKVEAWVEEGMYKMGKIEKQLVDKVDKVVDKVDRGWSTIARGSGRVGQTGGGQVTYNMSGQRCHRCKKIGHRVNECTESKKCYNCRKEGHEAKDCTEARKCNRCREEGHMMAECTKGGGNSWNFNHERRPRPGGQRVCYQCHKVGHIARFCRERG
jgi:hypothetical protein